MSESLFSATYARMALEHHTTARVLMVEVGAQESAVVGGSFKNTVKYGINDNSKDTS